MEENRKSITISTKNFETISTRIQNPQVGFSSVDQYVDYVLNEILMEEPEPINPSSGDEINEEETKKIQEELKKLGYI